MCEVATPGGGFAVAKVQVNSDDDLCVYHCVAGSYLVVLCSHAVLCDLNIPRQNI